MRALSIRQPFAELILRGVKTIEYRSRATRLIGERFWIYAAQRPDPGQAEDAAAEAQRIWSNDLAVPNRAERGAAPPMWMMELARRVISKELPTGVIVGSAVIERCEAVQRTTDDGQRTPLFEWHLAGVERAASMRKPARQPQPAWFRPF